MASKIPAAQMVTSHGIDMVIARGEDPAVVYDILDGCEVGTLFCSQI